MTRDEIVSRLATILEAYDLKDQIHGVDPWVADSLTAILAALRAPAVTGEAELPPRPPMPEPVAVPGLPRYGVTWQGEKDEPLLTPMPDGYWTPWHLAAAPPAAGAPPALVALVQEFQRTYHADKAKPSVATFGPHMRAYQALADWSPAPAPVAPPSVEHTCGAMHFSPVWGDVCPACEAAEAAPAPPAVAGGDAPPEKCSGCGASVELCLEYALTALGSTSKCCAQCDHGRRRQEGQ